MLAAWKKTVEDFSPAYMTEEHVEGLKTMIGLPVFEDIQTVINDKIKEYTDFHKSLKDPVGGFKMATGKFYMTRNSSIVFGAVSSDMPDNIQRILVIAGGIKTKKNSMEMMLTGSYEVGCAYVVTDLGKVLAGKTAKSEAKDEHPMDIMSEVTPSFERLT